MNAKVYCIELTVWDNTKINEASYYICRSTVLYTRLNDKKKFSRKSREIVEVGAKDCDNSLF